MTAPLQSKSVLVCQSRPDVRELNRFGAHFGSQSYAISPLLLGDCPGRPRVSGGTLRIQFISFFEERASRDEHPLVIQSHSAQIMVVTVQTVGRLLVRTFNFCLFDFRSDYPYDTGSYPIL